MAAKEVPKWRQSGIPAGRRSSFRPFDSEGHPPLLCSLALLLGTQSFANQFISGLVSSCSEDRYFAPSGFMTEDIASGPKGIV